KFMKRKRAIEQELERIKSIQITNKKEVNELLFSLNSTELKKPTSLYELIKRPELDYSSVKVFDLNRPELPDDVIEEVNIISKYEGYIAKQMEQIKQFKKFENRLLPEDM